MSIRLKSIFSNRHINSIYVWGVIFLALLVFKSIAIYFVLFFYMGLLPFLNAAWWFSLSSTGTMLRKKIKTWHWALISSWLLVFYSAFAKKWASGILNEIFHVDAGIFNITYHLLVFLHAPIGLLYNEIVLIYFFKASVVVLFLSLNIYLHLWLANLLPEKIKSKKISGVKIIEAIENIKKVALTSIKATIIIVFFVIGVEKSLRDFNNYIAIFALWADFNSNHLCADEWAQKSESVLFLGGSNMLAYHPLNEPGQQFKVEICQTWKSLQLHVRQY